MIITSVNNDLIKETAKLLQKKYRDESGLFLLEGEKSIREALDYGLEIINVFELAGNHNFEDSMEVSEPVMSKISSTVTPPKAVAVAQQIIREWDENFCKVLLLENIKDAGNLGTILRTSAAFGVDAVILYGETVDLYNPKCVRSSVGNLWKVPVFEADDLMDLRVNFIGYDRVATLPKSDNSIYLRDFKPTHKLLLMFGSEADGLSEELKEFATQNVTIEMSKEVESLNLSVSVAVTLYSLMN